VWCGLSHKTAVFPSVTTLAIDIQTATEQLHRFPHPFAKARCLGWQSHQKSSAKTWGSIGFSNFHHIQQHKL